MTNRKKTKRALLASVLSMLLCLTMLIGSTFAWFTDNATTSVNRIQAGTLDIELYRGIYSADNYMDDPDSYESLPAGTLIPEDILWEPGYLWYDNLIIRNVGSLNAKFQAYLIATSEIGELAKVIDVYVSPVHAFVGTYGTDKNVRDYINGQYKGTGSVWDAFDALNPPTKIGTLAEVISGQIPLYKDEIGLLPNGGEQLIAIALKMQENAGNEYQDKQAGSFDIVFRATQNTVEEDSYNDQYDKDANYAIETYTNFTAGEHTIDLSVADYIVTDDDIQDTLAAIKVNGDASATLKGNGTVKVTVNDTTTSSAIAVWARNGASIVIEDGTYIMERVEDNYQEIELIYVSGVGSSIVIKGGTYKSDNPRLTLNIHKSSNGTITVMGGTYWEFDPQKAEDAGVIIPDGYKVVSEVKADGTWYTVVAK